MAVMIQLRLRPEQASLQTVQALPGLADVPLERAYGLVCIDPEAGFYVVRAAAIDDLEARKTLSPEVVAAFGDIRISPI